MVSSEDLDSRRCTNSAVSEEVWNSLKVSTSAAAIVEMDDNGCAEHWRAQEAVTLPHTSKSVQVQLLSHPPIGSNSLNIFLSGVASCSQF